MATAVGRAQAEIGAAAVDGGGVREIGVEIGVEVFGGSVAGVRRRVAVGHPGGEDEGEAGPGVPFGGEVQFVGVGVRVAALQQGSVADEERGVGGLVEAGTKVVWVTSKRNCKRTLRRRTEVAVSSMTPMRSPRDPRWEPSTAERRCGRRRRRRCRGRRRGGSVWGSRRRRRRGAGRDVDGAGPAGEVDHAAGDLDNGVGPDLVVGEERLRVEIRNAAELRRHTPSARRRWRCVRRGPCRRSG